MYFGIDAGKLRYFAPDDTLIPTPEEAEQERLQKEIAQQQVEQLRERLRLLGNDDNLV